jgi:hypothetical protein
MMSIKALFVAGNPVHATLVFVMLARSLERGRGVGEWGELPAGMVRAHVPAEAESYVKMAYNAI